MPVFTLKNYDDHSQIKEQQENAEQQSQEQKQKEQEVIIQANDSVATVVATALYKKLGNVQESPQEEKKADTQVISTEDINLNPVDTLRLVKNKPNVVIISNGGFKTPKEEWFLSTLQNSSSKVYYSLESYLKTLEQKD